MNAAIDATDIASTMDALGREAVAAAGVLALASTATKNAALTHIAAAIRANRAALLAANALDMDAARAKGVSGAMLDRLALDAGRIESMARGVEEIAALADPVGTTIAQWTRPNGLDIARVRVPLGVIGIIYESRPNVTCDAGALCLKSGNAAILRGGSESVRSSRAIHACLTEGLEAAGLPATAIQIVPTTDRAAVGYLLSSMTETIDVVVPRGGKSLVARVQQEARVPVIGHLEGVCHVYVDRDAELTMARAIVKNAKLRRTGVCGSAETLLVDAASAATQLAPLVKDLLDAGCEAKYGSSHTESIVTANAATAQRFLDRVDSAIVLHNASTQFADGGEFGMGAEIGISTDRFHARGPVGVEQLCSYKYIVRGTGQVRP
jgi:glutamate-5-semialdehyde dehydrogenase